VPDGAKALERLAREKSAAGRSWNIPGAGTITGREIIRLIAETIDKYPQSVPGAEMNASDAGDLGSDDAGNGRVVLLV